MCACTCNNGILKFYGCLADVYCLMISLSNAQVGEGYASDSMVVEHGKFILYTVDGITYAWEHAIKI